MMKHLGIFCLLALALCGGAEAALYMPNSAPHSDFAWVPDYKKLFLRGGASFLSTASNFDNAGNLANITGGAEVTRNLFFIAPEYGLAPDWSLKMQLGVLSSSVNNSAGTSTLSSSGFADMNFSLKWMVRPIDPLFTFEGVFVIPTAAATAPTKTDVPLGDGAFGAGLKLNTVHDTGSFSLGFSPGFLYRNKGYSMLITGDAFLQFDFRRGYLRGYGNISFPLVTPATTAAAAPVAGSSGSYLIGSASPFGFSAGGKLGIKIYEELFLEAWFTRSFVGQRYPNYNQFGIGLFYAIDFLEVLPVKTLREVPFDADEKEFYKGK